MGCSESLCKEQSQITLFKSPLIRSREKAQIPTSVGESAGKSAGKKRTPGGIAGSTAGRPLPSERQAGKTALLPAFPPRGPVLHCALPTAPPRTFGDSCPLLRADFWEGDAMKHFWVKKRGSQWKGGGAIQWIRGLVRISTGKAIQWRGSGHSLNRRTLKTEKMLSSSPPRKSALTYQTPFLGYRRLQKHYIPVHKQFFSELCLARLQLQLHKEIVERNNLYVCVTHCTKASITITWIFA